ncbi:MAG TPA: hypothetical protein VGO00_10240 [Kofleriaceae bacterium]|jgi:hypothetical protein|nr:hypothetical protein [Kofleriaceae bacterium]
MRIGGLAMVISRAADLVPAMARYRRAVVLGALREDVAYLPGLPRPFEHLSLSHFWGPTRPGGFVPGWPGARFAADRKFARAVRRHRRGDVAGAFVELGRASHLVIDMACPVHVHRVLHDSDGYEWFVDTHADELGALPVPHVPRARSASELVEGLARFTHRFAADRTQHPVGRWMVRRGLAKSIPQTTIRDAARQIVPIAIGHVAALFELFVETARA